MERKEIDSKVKELIAQYADCDVQSINDHNGLEKDLGLDSLDRVELVMNIEKEFNICISDDKADSATTVKDIVDITEEAISNNE